MTASSIVLGAVLSFANSDGNALQLTVSLSRAATAALSWGELSLSSTTAKDILVFRPLPVPGDRAIEYALRVASEPAFVASVDPIGRGDRLKIAVYGDSREGTETHRILIDQMRAHAPDVIIHTGDVVRTAGDEEGWVRHLATMFPLSSKRPLLLALGNHELWKPEGSQIDGLAETMARMPPPDDALAKSTGVPIAVYHVRVGPALIIALDSNSDLSAGSPQISFLEKALAGKGDARFVFVTYHHSPLSSGPHGGHPQGANVIRLLEKYGVTASIGGHDHLYERIVYNDITYLISGGGGAPLYARRVITPGSIAFAAAYNWVEIELEGERARMETFSLEGATLDKASLVPLEEKGAHGDDSAGGRGGYGAFAVVLLLIAFVWVGRSLARASSS